MLLKEGQMINDGENDLIVCATKEYEDSWYVYLLNDKTDELGFYKVSIEDGIYDFKLVEDETKIQELILVFAKDYAKNNPTAINEVNDIINSTNDD